MTIIPSISNYFHLENIKEIITVMVEYLVVRSGGNLKDDDMIIASDVRTK